MQVSPRNEEAVRARRTFPTTRCLKFKRCPTHGRTADVSVPSTQPPPGPKGRGSLELWGPEPGNPFEPPGCASVVHPLRRRLSPWSTRRSPKPVEKGEGNCGAGDWGGGREGQKNLAVDDYRPEKTHVFLLHEIVRANFIPVFAGDVSAKTGQSLQMNALQYPHP